MSSVPARAVAAVLVLAFLLAGPAAAQLRVHTELYRSKTKAKTGAVSYSPWKTNSGFGVVVRLYELDELGMLQPLHDEGGVPWEETLQFEVAGSGDLGPGAPSSPGAGQFLLPSKVDGTLDLIIGSTRALPDDLETMAAWFTTQIVDAGKKQLVFEESPAQRLGTSMLAGPQGPAGPPGADGPHTGGVDNVSPLLSSFVGGGSGNQATAIAATVGGGGLNLASATGATIAGGGRNTVSGQFGAVGGGDGNVASAARAAVAGGFENEAMAGDAFIGGGVHNVAAGGHAVAAGGLDNLAQGAEATVGGGWQNQALGDRSTVPGGFSCIAGGLQSFATGSACEAHGDLAVALGRLAHALDQGSFVFGDSQPGTKPSTGQDSFTVYARGGARFISGAPDVGVELAPGSGSWASLSDRDAKANVEQVDARAVLAAVRALPVSTWSYRDQPGDVRHMGPMAQDFAAAFGLGADDRHITTVDSDGVALAAIKGLAELVDEKQARIERLEARLAALEELLSERD